MKWLLISVVTILHTLYTNSELRFVFQMFRHGAKSPGVKNGKDILGLPWDSSGELTPIGMRMEYLLGHRNRLKYEGFFGNGYSPEDIYITSTEANRTISSSLSYLDGLYPPSTGPTIDKSRTGLAVPPVDIKGIDTIIDNLGLDALQFRQQVFPIHTIQPGSHWFYLHQSSICPNVQKLVHKNLKKEQVVNFIKSYGRKYSEALIKALNYTKHSFDSFDFINEISTAFISGTVEGKNYTFLEIAGINLTEFLETSYESLRVEQFEVNYGDDDQFVGHMAMSPIHREIIHRMDTRIEYDSQGLGYKTYVAPKMFAIAAHNTDIVGMQVFLNYVFPQFAQSPLHSPNFASSLYYEFYRRGDARGYNYSDYMIDVLFDDIKLATFNYEVFRYNVLEEAYTQRYINHYCGFYAAIYTNEETILIIFSIILGVCCFTLIVALIVMCLQARREYQVAFYHKIVK
jgi:hypothetical protein